MPKLLKDKRVNLYLVAWNAAYTKREETLKGSAWAHFRSMSVREVHEANAEATQHNAYFTITKPSTFTIDTSYKIEYPIGSGNRWTVTGFDLFEDKDGANIRIQASKPYNGTGADDYEDDEDY